MPDLVVKLVADTSMIEEALAQIKTLQGILNNLKINISFVINELNANEKTT